MKRTFALMLALVMTFGAYGTVFAQTVTRGVGYNVVVNGVAPDFAYGEAVNVDGTSMFTVEGFSKFFEAGLTSEKITSSAAFNFEGKNYYSLRDIAAANGLNVYWDSATKTALVVNKDKYDKMKSIFDASNKKQEDFKKVEVDMNGDVAIFVEDGGDTQSLDFPLNGSIKMDIEAPYMDAKLKMSFMGTDIDMQMYDDGEFQYVNSGDGWFKTASSLAMSKELMEQIKTVNPSTSALAEDLSIAGLKFTENNGEYTMEGDMYVSETFKSVDIAGMMSQVQEVPGMSISYDWPSTVYVKYVIDSESNIKSMTIKFNVGMSMGMGGDTTDMKFGMNLDIPKFVVDGEFETVVPQTVKDSAKDFSVPEVADAPAAE